MVQRTVDNKLRLGAETLRADEVLGICRDGPLRHHHPLGIACGARSEEQVGSIGRETDIGQAGVHRVDIGISGISRHRHTYRIEHVHGKIPGQEVSRRCGAHHHSAVRFYAIAAHRLGITLGKAIKLRIGEHTFGTHHSRLVGTERSMPLEKIFEGHGQSLLFGLFGFHQGHNAVERLEIARSGIGSRQLNAEFLRKNHQHGGDTERIHLGKQKIAIKIHIRDGLLKKLFNTLTHNKFILHII